MNSSNFNFLMSLISKDYGSAKSFDRIVVNAAGGNDEALHGDRRHVTFSPTNQVRELSNKNENDEFELFHNDNRSYDTTGVDEYDGNGGGDDDDEESNLIGSGASKSSKFLGIRKSFIRKFQFPKSRRNHHNNKKHNYPTEPNPSNRSHSVNSQFLYNNDDYSYSSEDQPGCCSNFIYSLFARIYTKLIPSSFIMNTASTDGQEGKLSKVLSAFKTMLKYIHYVKTAILFIYLALCVVIIAMYSDGEESWNQTVISFDHSYQFNLENIEYMRGLGVAAGEEGATTASISKTYFSCKLYGPFMVEDSATLVTNINYVKIDVISTNKLNESSGNVLLSTWSLNMNDEGNGNVYSKLSTMAHVFEVNNREMSSNLKFEMSTSSKDSLGINFNCKKLNKHTSNKTAYSVLLLVFVYGLIMFDIIHRTLAAALG